MKFKILHLISLVAITSIVTSCNNDADEFILNSNSNSRSIEGEIITPSDVYPSVSEIIADETVNNAMLGSWYGTLSFASYDGRREEGFYIYYDFYTRKFSIGEIVFGPIVKNGPGTKATVWLGAPKNNATVCAFFHTHTPLTFCLDEADRPTGPSEEDIAFAESSGLPGIVYDYSVPRLPSGHHLIKEPAKLYTFGVDRRKNPLHF